jgi:hypothetical protein
VFRFAPFFLLLLATASPACASGTSIPEPSNLALFGLGVLGVLIGRYSAWSKRD